ncbi:MAG: type II toxin-antitoxin system VapC family toxin [Chloroflexi bacterium]|nr:type II toxin-antitoxin system VapC family toxin [Chloroflexota bacterium]
MRYLIDIDWSINALGRKRSAGTILRPLFSAGVAVSLLTIGELYEGASASVNPEAHLERLQRFLLSFRIVGINEPMMRRFGEMRSQLRGQGELIPDIDLLIAATALHYDLTLLTFNRRHFERIEQLCLYQPTLQQLTRSRSEKQSETLRYEPTATRTALLAQ